MPYIEKASHERWRNYYHISGNYNTLQQNVEKKYRG